MDAPRVLLTTEGTYPFVVGGVSSWCDLLVRGATEVHWQLMPLVAAGETESPAFQVPAHAQVVEAIELWNPADRPPPVGGAPLNEALPAELARALLRWDADPGEAVWPLVWARLHPGGVRPAFRSRAAWEQFAVALDEIVRERSHEATPSPLQTAIDAARLYQTLYWVARVAASPTPETDLIMVTAAGWAAIPALVHRALHGTPVLLVEHGVYVREAYLAAARAPDPPPRAGARRASPAGSRGRPTAPPTSSRACPRPTRAGSAASASTPTRSGSCTTAWASPRPPRSRRRARAPSSRSAASTRSRTSTRCCAWPTA